MVGGISRVQRLLLLEPVALSSQRPCEVMQQCVYISIPADLTELPHMSLQDEKEAGNELPVPPANGFVDLFDQGVDLGAETLAIREQGCRSGGGHRLCRSFGHRLMRDREPHPPATGARVPAHPAGVLGHGRPPLVDVILGHSNRNTGLAAASCPQRSRSASRSRLFRIISP